MKIISFPTAKEVAGDKAFIALDRKDIKARWHQPAPLSERFIRLTAKKIDRLDALPADFGALYQKFNQVFVDGIDAGEKEALLLLNSGRFTPSYCGCNSF